MLLGMTRLPIFLTIISVVGLGGFLLGQNRPIPTRIGMINSEKVIQAHKDFPKVKAVQDQAKKELDPILERLKPLDEAVKGGKATAKQQEDYRILTDAYTRATRDWTTRQQTVLAPITAAIDKEITAFARAQSIALILDERVSSESALVVFRDDVVDLTDAVIKTLK